MKENYFDKLKAAVKSRPGPGQIEVTLTAASVEVEQPVRVVQLTAARCPPRDRKELLGIAC